MQLSSAAARCWRPSPRRRTTLAAWSRPCKAGWRRVFACRWHCRVRTPAGRSCRRWSTLREFELADSILKLLAEGLAGTVPELLGAMLQLEVPARQEGRRVDARRVREFLSRRDEALRPKLRDIAALTARHFSLRLADLRGASRRRLVVAARDVAIYVCRQLTSESLGRIGEYFGGRDHTTVLHACRKAQEQMDADPAIRQAIDQLQRKLAGPKT